jgi:hypothetical protein
MDLGTPKKLSEERGGLNFLAYFAKNFRKNLKKTFNFV